MSNVVHTVIVRGHQFVDKLMREVIMDSSAESDREEIIRNALAFGYKHNGNQFTMNEILLPSGKSLTHLDELRWNIVSEIAESFPYGNDWQVVYREELAARDLIFLVTYNEGAAHVQRPVR
ncbi:hypothetical protein [Vibrio phage vB_VmeM-Yong XC32]|nr:hypothetical protein [Vibrio phage vB_VmeM-Yong XC31]QAX96385.1 hypothetical protein [Vibrio phage vB_VmeM-Yong XC32]QAX96703.1 hypothetical protein [Vibrio phage vB_VmeM-Yong MS31]QAX97021.1 hypothetical protein [Vibrio phage vB_VmeM-Yong MS32]